MHSTTMKNVVRRGMFVIGIAGGITILGSGIAASSASADEAPPGALVVSGTSAGDDDETTGEDGTASGNQVEAACSHYVNARYLRTARVQYESRYYWDNWYHVGGLERGRRLFTFTG